MPVFSRLEASANLQQEVGMRPSADGFADTFTHATIFDLPRIFKTRASIIPTVCQDFSIMGENSYGGGELQSLCRFISYAQRRLNCGGIDRYKNPTR